MPLYFLMTMFEVLYAGPERIELPSHGSKPCILSIELKADCLVLKYRIELSITPYHGVVMPLNYKSERLERVTGIEPVTCPWQGYVLPLAPHPHKENPGANTAHHSERPMFGGLDMLLLFTSMPPASL